MKGIGAQDYGQRAEKQDEGDQSAEGTCEIVL